MTPTENELILLTRRPQGNVDEDCFTFESQEISPPGPGEVHIRNIYLSCDPYLRLNMSSRFELGKPIPVRAVGEVVATADPRFAVGDVVWGFLAWERYSVARAADLTLVDSKLGPLSHAISVRGMIGLTAWVGMMSIGQPAPGDTVVVSAAAGAVGSVAGQLARLAGARVVGIAGGERKVSHVVENLGYDAAIDYKSGVSLKESLADACPDGVDVYFDNVGGTVLNAVLDQLGVGARLAICGGISQYQVEGQEETNLAKLMGSGATMKWFSIYDHLHELPAFVTRMARLVGEGKIVYYEDIADGFENVIPAFLGLFRGENLGKRLVRVSDEP
jgi:NADPH:quinone reductase